MAYLDGNFHPSAFQSPVSRGPPAYTSMSTSQNSSQDLIPYTKRTHVSVGNQVSAKELGHLIAKKEASRLQPFAEVTKMCYSRLKKLAASGKTAGYYDVPVFVSGLPLYSASKCAEFVACHLRGNGYDVTRVSQQMLLIRWTPPVENSNVYKDVEMSMSPRPIDDRMSRHTYEHNDVRKNHKLSLDHMTPRNPQRVVHEVVEKSPPPIVASTPIVTSTPNKTSSGGPIEAQPEDARLFKAISLLKPSGKFSLVFD